jgi:hypothetical protein
MSDSSETVGFGYFYYTALTWILVVLSVMGVVFSSVITGFDETMLKLAYQWWYITGVFLVFVYSHVRWWRSLDSDNNRNNE